MKHHFTYDHPADLQAEEFWASHTPEPARPPLSTLSGRHASVATDELARLQDEGWSVYRQQCWDRMVEL